MPFKPSGFEWWQWLLLAIGALIAWAIFYAIGLKLVDDHAFGALGWLLVFIGWLAGLAGLVCAVIGVIRFVKWAWSG
jgi:hypothetical protein